MPRAELVSTRIVLQTEFRDRDLIRAVPGARFDKDAREWHVPLSWASCLTLRGVFGERLEVGDELQKWAFMELEQRIEPAMEARQLALDINADTAGDPRLYSYQRTGVRFLVAAGSAVLADEMGTGKTVQAIAALEQLDAYPALIVCPNSVKANWRKEFERWAPHREVVVCSGGAATKRKALAKEADVYVINWEGLRSHSRLAPYGSISLSAKEKELKELNRPWGAVVADEAHKAKDPKSQQARALWAIGATARHRFAMTGTPIAQHPGDFWSLLHFVSPEEWPSRSRYIDRYCVTGWNAWGGLDIVGISPQTAEEFFRIVDPRFVRRLKRDVLPQLPPKIYERRLVTLGAKQLKAYRELEKNMVAEVDGGVLMTFNELTLHGRLSQAASAMLSLDGDQVVLTEPSAKLDALDELREELGEDEPLVVFAASRKLLELAAERLQKKGVAFGMVTGAVSESERQAAVEAFQAGRLQVILLTAGAGSEGLTLTRAKTLVFLQRSYSLVENKQAEDRIHRPGAEQHDSLLIVDLVAEDTIEERVADVLENKDGMSREITRDEMLGR
jgi:SNF2 family DNA or RNA helicase